MQLTIDRTVLDELDDDERTACPHRSGRCLARASKPKTVEQLEADLANKRYSPYVPVPVAGDVPEELKIWIDEHAEELPRRRRRARRRAPLPLRAARRARPRLHGPDHRRGVRREGRVAEDVHPQRQDREVRRREDLRGRPARHARHRSIEVDAENQPIRVVSEKPPIPGDDLVLNLDIDVQAQAEQALQSGLAIAKDRPCTGCQSAPKAQKGSTVVLDPKTGGVIAMASYPTFNPADFVDGISDIEWAALTAEENNTPLNNWAIQGQYAPGSTFKPFSAVAGLESGSSPPTRPCTTTASTRSPTAPATRARSATTATRRTASVDLRRSLTVSSDFYYYGLGAQFWIQQDRVGGPEKYADLLKQFGLRQRHRHRPLERAGRPHPVARVARPSTATT